MLWKLNLQQHHLMKLQIIGFWNINWKNDRMKKNDQMKSKIMPIVIETSSQQA
jgi:hypothetical protein